MNPLALRLYQFLKVSHDAIGVPTEPLEQLLAEQPEDAVYHEVGRTGVLAFIGDYVLGAWPPDEQYIASKAVHRLTSARLRERGFTRHVVHPRNFRSVKLTRKIGAKPVGVDQDGFVHYVLESGDFPHHVD